MQRYLSINLSLIFPLYRAMDAWLRFENTRASRHTGKARCRFLRRRWTGINPSEGSPIVVTKSRKSARPRMCTGTLSFQVNSARAILPVGLWLNAGNLFAITRTRFDDCREFLTFLFRFFFFFFNRNDDYFRWWCIKKKNSIYFVYPNFQPCIVGIF